MSGPGIDAPPVRPGAEPFSSAGGPVGVLLVHGFTGSPASMRPIGEWLAAQGLAIEVVRLPGHGTSEADLATRRWGEWTDEAARGLEALRSRCRTVMAFGQSMGASVVLHLAATRGERVDGVALANPYVFDARHRVIPVARLLVRSTKGIANDVARPGQDELAYDRMPTPAIVQMAAMLRVVRAELGRVRQPLVIFASGTDHVVSKSNPRKVLGAVGSRDTELIACPRSYHVVTLDHDADLVRERLLVFARSLDEGRT